MGWGQQSWGRVPGRGARGPLGAQAYRDCGEERGPGTGEGKERSPHTSGLVPPTQYQTCSKLLVAGQLQCRLRGESHRVREGGVCVGRVAGVGGVGLSYWLAQDTALLQIKDD